MPVKSVLYILLKNSKHKENLFTNARDRKIINQKWEALIAKCFLLLLIKSSINQKYQTVEDELSYRLILPETSKFELQHSVHLLLYDLEKNEYLNTGVNKLGDWSSKLQINTAPLLCVAGMQI